MVDITFGSDDLYFNEDQLSFGELDEGETTTLFTDGEIINNFLGDGSFFIGATKILQQAFKEIFIGGGHTFSKQPFSENFLWTKDNGNTEILYRQPFSENYLCNSYRFTRQPWSKNYLVEEL